MRWPPLYLWMGWMLALVGNGVAAALYWSGTKEGRRRALLQSSVFHVFHWSLAGAYVGGWSESGTSATMAWRAAEFVGRYRLYA